MTIKMDELAGSGNDEFYTPKYAVKPITKFIKQNSVIWCPFDTEKSWFVKVFEDLGHKVYYTHIDNGEDFFKYLPKFEYDYIISNPPYSLKNEVFAHLFHLGKPFAILLGVVGVFEGQVRTKMFRKNDIEVLYLTSRVDYFGSYDEQKPLKSPPFQSAYFCYKILPKQIMFSDIEKKDLTDTEQISLF
jgi:hypothetical protein